MEWVTIIVLVVIALLVFGAVSSAKQAKADKAKTEAYSSAITAAKSEMIKSANQASLPVIDAAEKGYRPVAKEALLAVQNGATRMEMKSTGRYRVGGTSVSIPIMKGVR